MSVDARAAVTTALMIFLSPIAALAVTVEIEVASQGEPIPQAEISFETAGGEVLALSEVEPAPAQPAPQAQPRRQPPSRTVQPAARPAQPQPRAETEPEPETTAVPTTPAEAAVTRIETDARGRAEAEISDDYRDEPVFIVVRKDGREVSRQRVALTDDPVRLRIDVPASRLARGSEPAEAQPQPGPAKGPSVSLYGKGGSMDRGRVSFLRTEIGGIVVTSDFAEVEREDAFYGIGGTATYPLGTQNLMGLRLGLNVFADGFWGTSDVDETIGDVSANGNQLGILGPEGPGGPLGGGLITDPGFGDLTEARYSDDYEELLFRIGLSGTTFAAGAEDRRRADPPIYFTPRIAFLYGQTDEDGSFSGTTNDGTVSFEYGNRLESDRYGGELGLRADVPLSTHFGVYLDGGLRVTYDDAKGSTSLEADFLGVPFPSEREDFSESGWHLGGTIGGGLSVNYGNVTGSLGVQYETWQIPVSRVTGTEPAGLEFERRESIAGTVGIEIRF